MHSVFAYHRLRLHFVYWTAAWTIFGTTGVYELSFSNLSISIFGIYASQLKGKSLGFHLSASLAFQISGTQREAVGVVVVVVPSSCCEDSVCVHRDQSIVEGGIKLRYSAILHHTGTYTRNQMSNHTSYCFLHKQHWWSELWEWKGWADITVN